MADQLEFPFAQGPAAAEPQTQQGVEGAQQPDAQSGIDKRIGEITARMYAAQELAAKKDEQILALTSKMTDFMSRQAELSAPKEQPLEVPEGLDPAQAAYFERMVARIEAKYEQNFVQVQAGLQRNEAAGVAAQLAQRFGVKDPSGIQQRAADLAAAWRQKGYEFTSSDAADFAFMEHLKNGGIPTRAPNGQFAAPTYAVTNGSSPQTNYAPVPQRQALPSNFDSLSPDQQIAELSKRGIDDLPL